MIKRLLRSMKIRKLTRMIARTTYEFKTSTCFNDMTLNDKRATATALATLIGVELDSPDVALMMQDLVEATLK